MGDGGATYPSEVEGGMGFFDRFAERASGFFGRAPWFAAAVVFVIGWVATEPFFGWNNEIWHLLLNSPTTAVTFLLVSLQQNSQARANAALQHKLNAMSEALADLMEHTAGSCRAKATKERLLGNAAELRTAVGLEARESA